MSCKSGLVGDSDVTFLGLSFASSEQVSWHLPVSLLWEVNGWGGRGNILSLFYGALAVSCEPVQCHHLLHVRGSKLPLNTLPLSIVKAYSQLMGRFKSPV